MMSQDEINILNNISSFDNLSSIDQTKLPITCDNLKVQPCEEILFLSAILYFSPTHWTIWINDKTYTADDVEDDSIKIIKVNNQQIELEIKNKNQNPIKLRANQSLVTLGYRIIDGDARQKSKSILL